MIEQEKKENLTKDELKVLDSIRPGKIIVPVVIGILAILYLSYRQFDMKTFLEISWTSHVFVWIGIALILLLIRHYALAWRLRKLSDGHFSLWKCIELVFIWEFSSAVSPTSLGGSIVAFFMLAQEKLSAARTATIVLYTIIVDTFFFMVSITGLILIFSGAGIRPGAVTLSDTMGWGATLISLTLVMSCYGVFFFYGMFINPRRLKWALIKLASTKWTRKWKENAVQIGDEIILASHAMMEKKWTHHVEMVFYTFVSWSLRFLILNALIVAFVPDTGLGPYNQLLLWARSANMYMIMAFSPTPGGSGIAEIFFEGFLMDFIPVGLAIVIALMWRIVTYYTYLIGGVFVIPNWIRKVLKNRRSM